jgi:hypothetical protein
LGYSADGIFVTKLFAGAVYDSYKMTIFARICDDENAFSTFEIPIKIIVTPDFTMIGNIVNNLLKKDTSFLTNKILFEGSNFPSMQEMQKVSSLLNEQSWQDKQALKLVGFVFPQIYGPLSNLSGVLRVNIFSFYFKRMNWEY